MDSEAALLGLLCPPSSGGENGEAGELLLAGAGELLLAGAVAFLVCRDLAAGPDSEREETVRCVEGTAAPTPTPAPAPAKAELRR